MYRRLVGLRRLSRADAIRRLQLEHDFSESDLKTAYLEKAKQFHPDNSTDDGEKFNQIKEAYQLLKIAEEDTKPDVVQNKKEEEYKKYLDQDEHLRKRYIDWRDKQLASGKAEDELLTEEQYISQARGVEAKMKNSFKRIGLAMLIFLVYLNLK